MSSEQKTLKGTVRLWFKPDWSSASVGGQGPTNDARLLEVGDWGNVNGHWLIKLTQNGSNLLFFSSSSSSSKEIVSAPINFTANHWHQIVLTYSPSYSALYINGELAGDGPGVTSWPNATARSAWGMQIGYDGTVQQVRGCVDELETFNYPLSVQEVAAGFPGNVDQLLKADRDYDGRSDFL